MKASLTSRMAAYLIDIIIVLVILSLVSLFYKPETNNLTKQIDILTLKYTTLEITFDKYIEKLSTIYQLQDQKMCILNIIAVVLIIIYFIILPYLNNGQTIGKQIMKINVRAQSNQRLLIIQLIIRNLIINGLLYFLAIIILSFIVPASKYLMIITILGTIQISIILISMVMVIYRKDKKGLHDLSAKTWVAKVR